MTNLGFENKRIAILNLWWTPNYGAALTGLALHRYTEELGHESTLICYDYFSYKGAALKGSVFHDFAQKELRFSPIYRKAAELKDLNDDFDCFIVGSDQVWRYEYTNNTDFTFFFKFVEPEKKLISYAASIGISEWTWPESTGSMMRCLIQRFDAVSVRELSAVALCRDYMDCEAEWVLDPVFFYAKDWWSQLADKAEESLPANYVATYILDSSADIQELIDAHTDLPKINIAETNGDKASVYYWLKAIRDSSCLITDSFHGMCFAIIFRKPFVVFGNIDRGFTRFESMLGFCQLSDHLVEVSHLENFKKAINTQINEAELDAVFAPFISKSKQFLKQELEGRTKNNKLSYSLFIAAQMQKEINSINKKYLSLVRLKYLVLSTLSWGRRRAHYQAELERFTRVINSL